MAAFIHILRLLLALSRRYGRPSSKEARMPCLNPSSRDDIWVEALHELLLVNRTLARKPFVELDVLAIVSVGAPGAVLTFSHLGLISHPVNTTERWAAFANKQGDTGAEWCGQLLARSAGARLKLEADGNGCLRWRNSMSDGAQTVGVWPDEVHSSDATPVPLGGEPLYSTFTIKFDRAGLQAAGFRLRTSHGLLPVGDDGFEVQVEGPDRAAGRLQKMISESCGDPPMEALKDKIGEAWLFSNRLRHEKAYNVVVLPHPRLETITKWNIGEVPPPHAEEFPFNVDGAPADMAFATPHSEATATALAPVDTKFLASLEIRRGPEYPDELDVALRALQ